MVGEVQRLRASARGHAYFELVEKGEGDEIRGKLDAVLWRSTYARVTRRLAASRQRLSEGLEIRCRVRVDFYPPAGRLQLVVDEVDPEFSLGLLERRRRETLAALERAGLLDRNRDLRLPPVALDVALVTSHGSAAYHDFLSTLRESGYGFRVVFVHSSVQGAGAEAELASALHAAGTAAVDTVVVVRGGGARSDLAVFDSRRVCEAVARCPVPVIAGLGHEIDEALADRVAHTAVKTPTGAAEMLVERAREAERAIDSQASRLLHAAAATVRDARGSLTVVERALAALPRRLAAEATRLRRLAAAIDGGGRYRLRIGRRQADELSRRLTKLAPRLLEQRRANTQRTARRIERAARRVLREASTLIEARAAICRQLAPERLLERGFSITRDAAGEVIKQKSSVAVGDMILTQLSDGRLRSRIEETV